MSADLSHEDEMNARWVEVMRSKTPEQKIGMVLECDRTMRLLLDTHFRNLHPDWDDATVNAAVARRMLGGTN